MTFNDSLSLCPRASYNPKQVTVPNKREKSATQKSIATTKIGHVKKPVVIHKSVTETESVVTTNWSWEHYLSYYKINSKREICYNAKIGPANKIAPDGKFGPHKIWQFNFQQKKKKIISMVYVVLMFLGWQNWGQLFTRIEDKSSQK